MKREKERISNMKGKAEQLELKEKLKRSLQSKEKGITLVALVITIVILIILAVVTINFAFGDSGLIRYAEDARDYQANADATDSELLNDATEYIDGIIGGNGGSGSDAENTTDDGVPIPDGFYYVGGTKEEGVVISDNPADENKGTSHEVAQTLVGNQFVWIPVEDDSLFKYHEGYQNGTLQSYLSSCSEPYASGYSTEQSEYDTMVASVLKNNGFYVGRYEAGTMAAEARTEDSGISVNDVVVQQGKNVYNYIGWSNSNDMTNEAGGAVEIAKNFDTVNGYTSVTSTLIYGVEWDAVMNFIDPAYATGSCAEDSFVRDSSGKGNYTGTLAKTGSNADYVVKNIYDLGGNVTEWTMEAYTTNRRSYRGGDFQRFRFWWSSFLS